MQVTGLTDIGKTRSVNQDSLFFTADPIGTLPNLFIVADGMGGHNGGEIASQKAVDAFCSYVRKTRKPASNPLDTMITAAQKANKKVYDASLVDPSLFGMGTTLTACIIFEGKCAIVHIGDSRAYLITPNHVSQLTIDHSYVNEMVKAGQLTPAEAREHPKRNVLTRVLGVDLTMVVDGYVRELEEDSYILLCSDGLTNMLTDSEIRDIVLGEHGDKAQALIDAANENGGMDNISVILIGDLNSSSK